MINIRKTGFACTAAVLLAAFGASLGQAQDRGVVRAADDGLLEGLFQTEIVNIGLENLGFKVEPAISFAVLARTRSYHSKLF